MEALNKQPAAICFKHMHPVRLMCFFVIVF